MDETIAVLIPIKSFNEAKERLSETLNKSERSLLMKKMAENVINSSATLPISPPIASISLTRCPFPIPPIAGLHDICAIVSLE